MSGGFRSLLIPIDLSPASDRLIRRVARLPLTDNARLTLLHVIPHGLSSSAHRAAKREAVRELALLAERLARTGPRGAVVRRLIGSGVPATEIAQCAASVNADLVVMGRCRSTLRTGFLGSTAERVLRRARRAVLVVRPAARARYRRPAIALEPGRTAESAVRLLLRVLPPPRPPVVLIHAYDMPYGAMYSSYHADDASAYRDRRRREVAREIDEVLSAVLERAGVPEEDAPRWTYVIRGGAPREVVANTVQKRDVDLLVLSTRGHSGVAYAYLGSVAGDLLRSVECDVLVAPVRPV